jgi:arabinan endo-1,5-alpha-L-arabinosidase
LRGEPQTILRASADWQLYKRGREMYGAVYDWHTLEGPCVLRRDGRYVCLYSGGPWTEDGYRVAHAVADHPLGPWTEPVAPPVLTAVDGHVLGPGHNSVTTGPDGSDVAIYHAWDPAMTARRLCIDPLVWTDDGPQVLGPTWEETELPRA